jgi:hypothetical protein
MKVPIKDKINPKAEQATNPIILRKSKEREIYTTSKGVTFVETISQDNTAHTPVHLGIRVKWIHLHPSFPPESLTICHFHRTFSRKQFKRFSI